MSKKKQEEDSVEETANILCREQEAFQNGPGTSLNDVIELQAQLILQELQHEILIQSGIQQ